VSQVEDFALWLWIATQEISNHSSLNRGLQQYLAVCHLEVANEGATLRLYNG
jgi:hypothetical protein